LALRAISRFTFDANGTATANGTLGTGATQGLAISPDGQFIYATSGGAGGNTIRQYDLSTGALTTAATVSSASRLFWMEIAKGDLYVAAVDGNTVYRLTIDASDDLSVKDTIPNADGAIAMAFSPDGNEMFTSGHLTTNVIDTFSYDASSAGWTKTAAISTPSSLAGILVLAGGVGGPVDAGTTTVLFDAAGQ
jgi:DNA-binding beta-propeller fold protein YncE